jgi:Asp-tRNA(Asn)/Glu-tRNA(Gln) amidotransferase A subunit family amidase
MPELAASSDVVNERLYRLESKVDALESDLSDQKVSMARITEQVASHEAHGVERHQQVMSAIQDMKTDYRALLKQQAEDARVEREAHAAAAAERLALVGKITLTLLGIASTVVAGMYGFSP